jgi:methylglutaconyl-CoA hydratase
MTSPYVNTSVNNRIATIVFFHPQSNSMPGSLLLELTEKIQQAGNNPEVSVIVLQSDGDGAFCAGASFDELVTINDLKTSVNFFRGFANVINAIRTVPKFVIARVHGKCVGGGVGIACAADYTIAKDTASIRLSELSIGIGPFVISPAVERKIGKAAFTQLTINANQWQNAIWAKEKGMYAEVYNTQQQLDEALNTLATQLASSNMNTMAELKKIFWEGTEHWDTLLTERTEIVATLAISHTVKEKINNLKRS